ncbi:hypothetical protein RJ640_024953 [Escallonia rubra]|uniref:Uncharacterized protein n=1 Tax=Escallonia rubra TaxID=112253 RepID=A0AA88R9W6_9ASTE|nr:hypothetical protein RJ640_024953 [Escallonia rubra]
MISTKTLAKMVKKWQNLVVIRRKRISFPRNSSDAPLATDKGHFVVYSEDGRRFVIPLVYLNNEVLIQLLKMSEEEFGLPGDGPITLPCDAFFMEYIISLLHRGVAEDLEKVLLIELFKMSEEEFGLPSDGPITLPCDAKDNWKKWAMGIHQYAVALTHRRESEEYPAWLISRYD